MITTTHLSDLDITPESRVLIVMPHPDDEAIFAGGFLHKLAANSIPTRVITMTVGEKSTLRYGLKPMDHLGEVREKELTRALTTLGIGDFHIYHFPDGGLEEKGVKIKETIRKNIKDFQTSHVVTLEPDGIYGHPDHVALSSYTKNVVVKPVQLWFVTVSPSYRLPSASWMAKKKIIKPMRPTVSIRLTFADVIAKLKSIQAHRSQFMSPIYRLPFEATFFLMNKLLTHEFFAKGN